MSHNILVTGASGYLGGTLLARWRAADLPPYSNLYALVRSDKQAQAVKEYGAQPLIKDLDDLESVAKAIIDHEITIVLFLIDAMTAQYQPALIKALGQVRKRTGMDVHFVQTTGTKQFSEHAGAPTDRPLLDTDSELYNIIRGLNSAHDNWIGAAQANTTVIDIAESCDVRSYVFAPCIVYGRGEGFGNRTSIQDVAIVKAALKVGRVCNVNSGDSTWPVCHIIDNTTLYLQILRKILSGEADELGYGKQGFYLASSGSVSWSAIYYAMAKALAKRGAIETDEVVPADEKSLAKMAEALEVLPNQVATLVGGLSTFTAVHGRMIGWVPQYAPEHILEDIDAEVEFILADLAK